MTAEQFRRLALAQPGAAESAHQDHPDFRVGGKVFATLGYPNDEFGMVRLGRDDQARFLREHPDAFQAAKGAGLKRGPRWSH